MDYRTIVDYLDEINIKNKEVIKYRMERIADFEEMDYLDCQQAIPDATLEELDEMGYDAYEDQFYTTKQLNRIYKEAKDGL